LGTKIHEKSQLIAGFFHFSIRFSRRFFPNSDCLDGYGDSAETKLARAIFITTLPGPSKTRLPGLYFFRPFFGISHFPEIDDRKSSPSLSC
jgi:hypothetical protein